MEMGVTSSISLSTKLFRTGVSSYDRNIVSEYLNAGENQLEEREMEIIKFTKKTSALSLENRRVQLKKRMDQDCSLLVSPVHRLPPEMLASIFERTCDKHELRSWTIPHIVTYSMVCGRWREVACSTPSLWANIYMDTGGWNSAPDIARLTRVLKLFLDRSKHAPLNLSILIPGDISPKIIELLSALSQSIDRWKTVHLYIPLEIIEYPALQLLPRRLSSLQHISLSSSTLPLSGRHVSLFHRSPSLTSLRLSHVDPPYIFEHVWPEIKDLDLCMRWSKSISFLVALLKVCPNMESLSVAISDLKPPPEAPIVASRIKHLKSSSLHHHPLFIFWHFSLPNLSTLYIMGQVNYRDVRIFSDFLSRSSCNITSLDLTPFGTVCGSYAQDVLSFLKLLPTLNHLRLDVRRGGNLFRLFLCRLFLSVHVKQGCTFGESPQSPPPPPPPQLLPHLTDLNLCVDAGPLNSEQELLVGAVRSRWLPKAEDAFGAGAGGGSVVCLRTLGLKVYAIRGRFVPSLERLFCLRDVGLRVDVCVTWLE